MIAASACVGCAARWAASLFASPISSASSTAFQIMPHCAACSAETGSASIASAFARASPSRCVSDQVPPQSGSSPILTKDWMNFADFAASTISPCSARLAPAPAATPLTATTIGFGNARRRRINGLNRCSMLAPTSTLGAAPPGATVRSERSCPAQNARPAPVSRMARQLASRSSAEKISESADVIPVVKLLSLSGRLRITVATAPSRCRITLSSIGIPPVSSARGRKLFSIMLAASGGRVNFRRRSRQRQGPSASRSSSAESSTIRRLRQ